MPCSNPCSCFPFSDSTSTTTAVWFCDSAIFTHRYGGRFCCLERHVSNALPFQRFFCTSVMQWATTNTTNFRTQHCSIKTINPSTGARLGRVLFSDLTECVWRFCVRLVVWIFEWSSGIVLAQSPKPTFGQRKIEHCGQSDNCIFKGLLQHISFVHCDRDIINSTMEHDCCRLCQITSWHWHFALGWLSPRCSNIGKVDSRLNIFFYKIHLIYLSCFIVSLHFLVLISDLISGWRRDLRPKRGMLSRTKLQW